jgi:transmembrane sensor
VLQKKIIIVVSQEQKEKFDKLWTKFLEKNISEEELILLTHLLKEKGNTELLPDIEEVQKYTEFEKMDEVASERIFANIVGKGNDKDSTIKYRSTGTLLKMAAVISLIIIAGLGAIFFTNIIGIESNFIEHSTSHGNKVKIDLGDGSTVWLSPQSKIKYRKDFGNTEIREIYLEGEAFFDVVKNEQKPFIVHTSSILVKVLGTSFNVSSYSEDKNIQTTLVTGKVRITKIPTNGDESPEDIILNPNEKAIFDKETQELVLAKTSFQIIDHWVENRMVFDNQDLNDVLKALERKYGIEIILEDKKSGKCRFTGIFEDESLDEALFTISRLADVKYLKTKDKIILKGKFCNKN